MSDENKNEGYDIAGDVGGSNINLSNEQNSKVIRFNVLEEQVYLGFKIVGFCVAISIATCFLIKGLDISRDAIMHIVHHQAAPTKQIAGTQPVNKSEKENSEVKKEEPGSMSNKILYSGSIITLVAFILGTGLTLLLTIVKFSFHSRQQNEDNPNVALAGPASELFMALASYIKSKIK